MKKEDLTYQYVIDNITPRLYDLEGMFWVVVATDLCEKYGREGEKAARKWMRLHAGWRGQQIRKGAQAVGAQPNCENLYAYTDLCINNAFSPMWKKEYDWTPYRVTLDVSPGECVLWDRFKQHDIGFLGDVFCDEMHISFTSTYHPDMTVVIPRCMTKGDDHCHFQWVMPGDAKEPEYIEPYPGEDVLADWNYDSVADICTGSLRKMMRWYAAEIFYLRQVLTELVPDKAEEEFERLLKLWEDARAECIVERNPSVGETSPREFLEYVDVPFTYTWQSEITDTEDGIEMEISYCPFSECWKWLKDEGNMQTYCDTCYKTMFARMNPDCEVSLDSCMTRGDKVCKLKITKSK